MDTKPENTTESKENLPGIRHFIKLYEGADQKLIIDISDETGGLGLRLYFDSSMAGRFGRDLAERARLLVSKDQFDSRIQEFTTFDNFEAIIAPWRINDSNILTANEVEGLHCDECGVNFRAEGGLKKVGAVWKCAKHRTAIDHSSHMNDVKNALKRAISGESSRLIQKILDLMSSSRTRTEIKAELRKMLETL